MDAVPESGHSEDMGLTESQCWDAVAHRDSSFDGRFFFGVLTTGVYCRPSCPARRPLRRNVRFYRTPVEAARDGLRPCLRCRPLAGMDPAIAKVLDLCRYIDENPDERLDLAQLAVRAALSRFHLQRSFKAALGITPKEYVEARRMNELKRQLREAKDVAAAIYGAGFGSSSRVYERADSLLGMTPNEYRRGGPAVIGYASGQTPAGKVTIGATGRGICFVQFGESEGELLDLLRKEYPAARLEPMNAARRPQFRAWMAALNAHIAGNPLRENLPLDVRATAFQMRVWKFLQTIPPGELRSYSEVAAGIGQPSAARAVARACAANTVAVLIPCHRVIRGTGESGGYRWGEERKRTLLEMERKATGPRGNALSKVTR